jgi:hypothetical protein
MKPPRARAGWIEIVFARHQIDRGRGHKPEQLSMEEGTRAPTQPRHECNDRAVVLDGTMQGSLRVDCGQSLDGQGAQRGDGFLVEHEDRVEIRGRRRAAPSTVCFRHGT